MTGGSIYVSIRDANGNKITLTTTSQNLKPGTWKKIMRGFELNKKVYLVDMLGTSGQRILPLYVDDAESLATASPIYALIRYGRTSDGVLTNINLTITKDDTIVINSSMS